MKFDNLSEIAAQGFEGFVTVEALQKSNCREVPYRPGVYLVVWPRIEQPKFLKESCGGHFKGKNPTVAVSMLADQWVEGANVIYIGKAGSATGEATLHKRLRSLMKFGLGIPIGHWGGRYIWQIADSNILQLCWKTTTGGEAPLFESQLIREFTTEYGRRPFANLRD